MTECGGQCVVEVGKQVMLELRASNWASLVLVSIRI